MVWRKSIISGKEVTLGETCFYIIHLYDVSSYSTAMDRFNVLQMGIVGSERVFKVLDTKDFIKDNGNVIKDQIEDS